MNSHVALYELIAVGSNFLDQGAFVLRSHDTCNGILLTKALIAIVVFGMVEGALESFGIHKGYRGGTTDVLYMS